MIALDDCRWSELRHAYGPAGDIPALLRCAWDPMVSEEERRDAEFSLWSALCHQEDVYSASYAAVPHLVENLLSSATRPPARSPSSMLQLVACIEISRSKSSGSRIPADLEADYRAAMSRLPDVIQRISRSDLDEGSSRVVCSALAASHGQPGLAEAILELEPEVLLEFMEWVVNR